MSEYDEQVFIFQWAALHETVCPEIALLHAIPNGAVLAGRGKGWNILRASGAKKGVPDMCLPVARHGYNGLYIELKFGDNKPSEEQVWWLDRLSEQGYLAISPVGADETIEQLKWYLGIS